MVLQKRVGTLFRETREEKKKSIREVSQETNITPRYIEALESEDYSVFPGETYALGFLRNYAEYLNLDAEQVINLYHGLQIDQSKTPLKELTRPAGITASLRLVNKRIYVAIGTIGGLLLVGGVYLANFGIPFQGGGIKNGAAAQIACADRQVINISVPPAGSVPRQEDLSTDNMLRFAVGTNNVKVCLEKIVQGEDGVAIGNFAMSVNDESVQQFRAAEGEPVLLNAVSPPLATVQRKVQFTPRVLGDFSARIEVESAGTVEGVESDGSQPAAVTAGDIQITLKFIDASYFEWNNDGNAHTGMIIEAGKIKTLEAKNRLEIKVGNGGGVQILKEGVAPRLAGPVGKLVKLIYRRVPDPLDPGLYKIQESIEVVR